jgi:hypothetical protein
LIFPPVSSKTAFPTFVACQTEKWRGLICPFSFVLFLGRFYNVVLPLFQSNSITGVFAADSSLPPQPRSAIRSRDSHRGLISAWHVLFYVVAAGEQTPILFHPRLMMQACTGLNAVLAHPFNDVSNDFDVLYISGTRSWAKSDQEPNLARARLRHQCRPPKGAESDLPEARVTRFKN